MEKEEQKGHFQTEKPNKKKAKDDILNIVRQFVGYFEEVDRSENNDNSI